MTKTFAFRFAAITLSLLPLFACSPGGSPAPVRYEDEPGWDCRTMGNGVCNPQLVEGRMTAKGAKPIQSITVKIMPEEVFFGKEGTIYVSHRGADSCVAWVDQAAVRAGQSVLEQAFAECGATFE